MQGGLNTWASTQMHALLWEVAPWFMVFRAGDMEPHLPYPLWHRHAPSLARLPCPLIRKLLTFISCIKNFLTKREQVGTSPEPTAPLPSLLEESLCMLIYTYSFTSKVITHVCAASGTGFLPWQKPPWWLKLNPLYTNPDIKHIAHIYWIPGNILNSLDIFNNLILNTVSSVGGCNFLQFSDGETEVQSCRWSCTPTSWNGEGCWPLCWSIPNHGGYLLLASPFMLFCHLPTARAWAITSPQG